MISKKWKQCQTWSSWSITIIRRKVYKVNGNRTLETFEHKVIIVDIAVATWKEKHLSNSSSHHSSKGKGRHSHWSTAGRLLGYIGLLSLTIGPCCWKNCAATDTRCIAQSSNNFGSATSSHCKQFLRSLNVRSLLTCLPCLSLKLEPSWWKHTVGWDVLIKKTLPDFSQRMTLKALCYQFT